MASWLPPPGFFLFWLKLEPTIGICWLFLSFFPSFHHRLECDQQSGIPSASVFLSFIKALQTNQSIIVVTSSLFFFCCPSTHNDTCRKEPSSFFVLANRFVEGRSCCCLCPSFPLFIFQTMACQITKQLASTASPCLPVFLVRPNSTGKGETVDPFFPQLLSFIF